VIPRFEDDAFFPGSAWSNRLRETADAALKIRRQQALELPQAIRAAIATLS
jgi:diadenosine tetraphosphate (Ap4A) HIT family hydrolase